MLPHQLRWFLLLLASCVFYAVFLPAYILLLFVTILIDYVAAIRIEKAEGRKRKLYLIVSVIATLSFLFVFKYFNFFNSNLSNLAHFLHWNYPIASLKLALPIGISFYTFQSLSYVIEVYRRKQGVERNLGIFALYVVFYPQLVAGPIERSQNLLHQFYQEHYFDYKRVSDGLKLMAWGMFKKVVIADRLALFVNTAYGNPFDYQGISLIEATVFFAFQIYCDFSGYSDIAVGCAEVMGFKLTNNFNRPYFSKSISEFWRRWHISLSTWFRDYLYIPLGGNRVSRLRWCYIIFVTFIIAGLWHGANWTYVIWGALNGFYLIVLGRFRPAHKFLQVAFTFTLVCFSWIFFRANNIGEAFYIVKHLFSGVNSKDMLQPFLLGQPLSELMIALCSLAFLLIIQLIQRYGSIRQMLSLRPAWFRWTGYCLLVLSILLFGFLDSPRKFIYFQF